MPVETSLLSVNLPDDLVTLGPFGGSTKIELLLDGRVQVQTFFHNNVQPAEVEAGSTGLTERASNAQMLAEFVAASEAWYAKLQVVPPFVMSSGGTYLTLRITDPAYLTREWSIRVLFSAGGSGLGGRTRNRPTDPRQYPLTRVVYDGFGPQKMTVDDVFELPMLANDGLYDPAKAPDFSGFVNYYDPDGDNVASSLVAAIRRLLPNLPGVGQSEPLNYGLNSETEPHRYALLPTLYYRWALVAVARWLGFTLDPGRLASDADLKRLILLHNVPLARQCPGTGLPFDVYNPDFRYATALPDWSVKQFFDEMQVLAARTVWDFDSRTGRVVFLDDVIRAAPVADWTARLLRDYTLTPGDEQPLRLKFALDGGNEVEKDTVPALDSYPPRAQAAAPGTEYQEREIKTAAGLPTPASVGCSTRTGTLNPLRTVRLLAYARQRGRSPLFGQDAAPLALPRLLFFTRRVVGEATAVAPGLPERTDAEELLRPTADAATDRYALQWNGPTGLHARFWKLYLNFLEETFDWRAPMVLNEHDLARHRWEDQVYVAGRACLVRQFRFELTRRGIVRPVEVVLNPV